MSIRTALLVAAVTSVVGPHDASADDAERATILFKEAQAIIDAGSGDPQLIDSACSKFEQSLRLDPQIGTRLNLADCRERQGRYHDAYRLYDQAADEASHTDKPGRATFARQRIDALASKLVRVVVSTSERDPSLEVRVNGTRVPRERWSSTLLAPPGRVTVRATAPDHETVRFEHDAVAGERIDVAIPVLTPRPRSRFPYLVLGVGAGVLLTGGLLGLHAKSRYDDAFEKGDPNRIDSAQTEADVGTVFFTVGMLATGFGTWLWWRNRETPDRVIVSPNASPTGGGVVLSGRF